MGEDFPALSHPSRMKNHLEVNYPAAELLGIQFLKKLSSHLMWGLRWGVF
jgi:hypothetical protein